MTEVSSDLKEYAAAQLIPKFGVHCYYAVSDEPLSEWRQAGDAGAGTASSAASYDRPRTECDFEELHHADCTLCPLTGSFLDEDQADFKWMEGRPQQYYTPLGTDAPSPRTCPPCPPASQTPSPPQRSLGPEREQVSSPNFPGSPISPTSPLRASQGRSLSPPTRFPRGPTTSSPIAERFQSPASATPCLEGPTSPGTPWLTAKEGLMLPPMSDLSSTGAYGTPLKQSTLDSTTRSPIIPKPDRLGRGLVSPFESGLSSLESFGTQSTSMAQATPPTSGTATPSSSRSPHSPFSRSPASGGTAISTPLRKPPISPASTSPRAPVMSQLGDFPPSEQEYWRDVTREQIFKESPSARGPAPVPRESPCDAPCSTPPQQQAAEAGTSRPSPYTPSHVPAYGRTAKSQPRIGEESLFPDLFSEDQPPQETTKSVVRRLRQQQAEGRERSRAYQAEVEASDRREQVQTTISRTPRTPAPTAAPMSSPHVAPSAPQPQQTPISRPMSRNWPAVLPQFPDLFGQGACESPITQIARRLQQQTEESRERTRRRVAHREQRVRDRELMLQQATGETQRSRREPPEAASPGRFQEEQPSAAQLMEECIEECTEAESPQSSPQAATEESSPETSYEFPSPIWSSSTKAEPPFVPRRGYGEVRYRTPSHRSPVKTEESSPESSYELAPPVWSSSRRTDGHKYVSTPAYGEERYRTPAQRACEGPCATESSESSPEPLPPPLWSSARREQSGPAPGPAHRPAHWDSY